MSANFFVLIIFVCIVATLVLLLRPFVKEKRVGWMALAGAALIPLAVVALYASVGQPDALLSGDRNDDRISQRASEKAVPAVPGFDTQGGKIGSVSNLVDGLAARLSAGDGDGGDWLLLAQSYDHLGNTDQARAAYREAAERGAVDQSLEQKLLFGSAKTTKGDLGFRIVGTLVADDAARQMIPPDATIFVVARAADGPAMPIAVAKYAATSLPLSFSLDTSNLMLPDGQASRYKRFTIYARVSKTGDASVAMQDIVSNRVDTSSVAVNVELALHSETEG